MNVLWTGLCSNSLLRQSVTLVNNLICERIAVNFDMWILGLKFGQTPVEVIRLSNYKHVMSTLRVSECMLGGRGGRGDATWFFIEPIHACNTLYLQLF